MSHYSCKTCGQRYDYCECGKPAKPLHVVASEYERAKQAMYAARDAYEKAGRETSMMSRFRVDPYTGEPLPDTEHKATVYYAGIADRWILECSCGWREVDCEHSTTKDDVRARLAAHLAGNNE